MKKIIILSTTFFFFGCWGNVVQDDYVNIDQEDELSIFDLVDSISVIPIETNPTSLIASIEKVLYHADRYYILDTRQQAVFCFDRQGRYIFKIDKEGQGPDEYPYIDDIAIDPCNQQLLLVVPFGSILYFDLNGEFVSKDNIPDAGAINEVHVMDANRLLLVSLNAYQMLYYSRKEHRIFKRLYPRDDCPSPFFPLDRAYLYNDSVYFSSVFSNEVLNMSDENQRSAFSWNFGVKNNTPKQQAEVRKYMQANQQRQQAGGLWIPIQDLVGEKKHLNYYILSAHESSRYRIALVEYQDDYFQIFIDKQLKRPFVFRRTSEGISFMFQTFQNECLIAYDRGYSGPRDIKYFAKSTLSPSQLKIVESHNPETDNPFLVVYHLKQ